MACFILTFTFPILIEHLGFAGTFWTYAIICALGYGFIFLQLPETKNKTLEEIEAQLTTRPAALKENIDHENAT